MSVNISKLALELTSSRDSKTYFESFQNAYTSIEKGFSFLSIDKPAKQDIDTLLKYVDDAFKLLCTKLSKDNRTLFRNITKFSQLVTNPLLNLAKNYTKAGDFQAAALIYKTMSIVYDKAADNCRFTLTGYQIEQLETPSLFWAFQFDNIKLNKNNRSLKTPTSLIRSSTSLHQSKETKKTSQSHNLIMEHSNFIKQSFPPSDNLRWDILEQSDHTIKFCNTIINYSDSAKLSPSSETLNIDLNAINKRSIIIHNLDFTEAKLDNINIENEFTYDDDSSQIQPIINLELAL